ncbi:MAG: PqiC family protein [Opitutaceae bacterium]
MKPVNRWPCCLLAFGLWFLASGCNLPIPQAQSDQTRYFLLTSAGISPDTSTTADLKRWVVGIRTVDVAAYLRTRSLAVRSHTNEIMFLDFTRWGEPLDQGITRVLAENLQSLRSVARVSTPPFRADEPRDFEVLIRVTACEGTTDGGVRFAATWRILASGPVPGTVAEGSYTAAGLRWDGHDHGQLVAKLSEALAGLSREIGVALSRQPAG